MNKHLETTWHIPKSLPRLKDHQNRAFGSDFSTSQVHQSLQIWPGKLIFFAIFSTFFQFFVVPGPVHLWKQIIASKYLAGGTTGTISGHEEQILALEMAISDPENWLKNHIFVIFSNFFQFFVVNRPVSLWKQFSASKIPY